MENKIIGNTCTCYNDEACNKVDAADDFFENVERYWKPEYRDNQDRHQVYLSW